MLDALPDELVADGDVDVPVEDELAVVVEFDTRLVQLTFEGAEALLNSVRSAHLYISASATGILNLDIYVTHLE